MPVARKRAVRAGEAEEAAATHAKDVHDVDGDGAKASAPADKAAEGVGGKQSASSKKPKPGDEARVVIANYNEVERWVRMPCTHFCRRTLRIDA